MFQSNGNGILTRLCSPVTMQSSAVVLLCLLFSSCHRSAEYYTSRGDKLYAEGKYADAALTYRKATQARASSGEAYAGLGLTELKLNQWREAYSHLSRATDLLPARDDLKKTLGDLITAGYFADRQRPKGLHDQLTKVSDQLMQKDPFDALRFKAYVAVSDNDVAAAEQYFEKANAIKPMQPVLVFAWCQMLFLTNQFEKGEKLGLDLIQKDKGFSPMYELLANQYVRAHRPDDAEKLLATSVKENPKDADSRLRLADFYARMQRREQMNATLHGLLDNPQDFPHAHMNVGDFYAGLQDWDNAIREYQAGIKTDPKEQTAYLKKITNVYLTQGKGAEASAVVHEIMKNEPANEEASGVNASLLLEGGTPEKLDSALAEFQKLAKQSPENPVWHYNLGLTYRAKKETQAAQGQFEEAIKLKRTYVPPRVALAEMSLERNAYRDALRYADQALALQPNLPKAMLYRSEGLMGTGNYSDARAQLERLEQIAPGDPETELQFGLLNLAEKRYKDAEERFRNVYEHDQRDPQALIGLVRTIMAEGHPDVAYRFLSDESNKPPYSDTTHLLLADTAAHLTKYEVAVDEYRHLLEKHPKSADLYMRIASAYRAKGETEKAIASLRTAIELNPAEPGALPLLASMLEGAGSKLEAIPYYRRAVNAQPNNLTLLNNLAFLMADVGGNLDEALELSQRVVKQAPQQADFADTLGWIYLKKGMTEAARGVFSNLTLKYPDNATFRYHLGLAMLQRGDKVQARKALEVALSKHPSADVSKGIQQALVSAGGQP
jgi:tetratricopeptide (TPR) repeat protein